ncbi:MAG: CDP-diacylglycerol--glycerol-3-phosphate 3-phosphatidyltransferase, partial [Pseudomonadota bacterium]
NTILQPSRIGKLKAVSQFTALVPLIVHYQYQLFSIPIDFHVIGTVFIYIALALTLWSGIDYFWRFYCVWEAGEGDGTP